MSTANYNALAGAPLTRGRIIADGTGLGNGATGAADIYCGGDSTLVLMIDMTGTAAGDLTVEVRPFEADNATVAVNQIPPVRSDGPDLAAGRVFLYQEYDVSALEKVQVRYTNNNAAPQTIIRGSWRLS